MDPIAFKIGFLSVHWYGLLIALAFVLGIWLACRKAVKIGILSDQVISMILWALPCAIIGARLYYVLFTWSSYASDPLKILSVWKGGLAIHGGLLGGILGGSLYLYRHRLPFWSMADLCVPSIILGQAIGRWGNFFNQEAYGSQVSAQFISHFPAFIQKQMWINGAYYHPAFLYESLWCLLGFLILNPLWAKRKFDGQLLALYLIFYSSERLFVEQLRTDSLMLGSWKMAQIVSLILILIGIVIYILRRRQPLWHLQERKEENHAR